MTISLQKQALSPLYDKPLFRSDLRVETHDFVANEFADHSLRWKAGKPDTAMHKTALKQVNIYTLRYGPEVEIRATPFDKFVLVHTSLHGGMEIDCDGRKLWVREGSTAILAPKKNIHLRWSPKNQQMIFKIPHSLLDAVAKSIGIDGKALESGFLLPQALDQQWGMLVHAVMNALSAPNGSGISPHWIVHLEQAIATLILLHKPLPMTPPKMRPASESEACNGKETIDILVDYIDRHLSAPISLQDFTLVTGLSFRTINTLCQRHFGLTPMELVRNKRLDAVHRRLLLDPHASVTEIATDFGFGHLGRFSAYYEARFMEFPRQTKRPSRRD